MKVEPFLEAARQREAVRRRFGFAPGEVVIGKIARLFHLKGHEFVIEAAKQVVAQCPQVRFLFVGDGILRPQWERRIAELELSPYFRFAGLVQPEEIPSMIGAMDVLVHASLREGLARALPQALIAGKPVVSFDVDGAREVVIPQETGFLVPPRSIAPLGQAMLQLAQDAELRQSLGVTGRQRFTDQFRHQHMTSQLRDLYEQILAR
jgi:glycosyltransferase involved in cell wall biosynthesis